MDSPDGVQAEKERSFYSLFYIFITGHQTVSMKEGLNGLMASTADG